MKFSKKGGNFTQIIIVLVIVIAIFLGFRYFKSTLFDGFDLDHPINTQNIVIYYINLDHREDRKQQFLEQMEKAGIDPNKITRISAVYKKKEGDIGCSMSHVKTMETFLQSDYEHCIVFEDDFEFVHDANFIKNAFRQFFDSNVDYDVCMISANEIYTDKTQYPFLKKVSAAQTTSGFMVSKKFAPTLLDNFKTGLELLQENYDGVAGDKGRPYCVDQYWQKLQPVSNWFIFEPKLGKQQDGKSDIMGGFVKMDV
jgi:GR25 family glycosyltransferase involved in LPS biosynthesis